MDCAPGGWCKVLNLFKGGHHSGPFAFAKVVNKMQLAKSFINKLPDYQIQHPNQYNKDGAIHPRGLEKGIHLGNVV